MKYLILAYGDEEAWNALSAAEQKSLLAQDDILRARGSLVAAVTTDVTTVTSWTDLPKTASEPFSPLRAPLAGFGIIEADNLAHAVQLVANTPCARAKGAVEIRPIQALNQGAAVVV
jgi:hypothetical protein